MVTARPSIATAFVWAYWDLAQVLRVLARPALIALAILVAAMAAGFLGPRILTPSPVGRMIVLQGIEVLACFLLTPFVTAVFRCILCAETPAGYRIDRENPQFRLLFGWLAVMTLLMNIPLFLSAVSAPADVVYYSAVRPSDPAPSLLTGAVRAAVFLCVPRLIVLLPAIAVGAPGTIWQNAFCDTQSRLAYVFAAVFLPALPIGFLAAGGLWTLHFVTSGAMFLSLSFLYLGACLLTLLTLSAVIAARLYQVLGDHLNQPLPET